MINTEAAVYQQHITIVAAGREAAFKLIYMQFHTQGHQMIRGVGVLRWLMAEEGRKNKKSDTEICFQFLGLFL